MVSAPGCVRYGKLKAGPSTLKVPSLVSLIQHVAFLHDLSFSQHVNRVPKASVLRKKQKIQRKIKKAKMQPQ